MLNYCPCTTVTAAAMPASRTLVASPHSASSRALWCGSDNLSARDDSDFTDSESDGECASECASEASERELRCESDVMDESSVTHVSDAAPAQAAAVDASPPRGNLPSTAFHGVTVFSFDAMRCYDSDGVASVHSGRAVAVCVSRTAESDARPASTATATATAWAGAGELGEDDEAEWITVTVTADPADPLHLEAIATAVTSTVSAAPARGPSLQGVGFDDACVVGGFATTLTEVEGEDWLLQEHVPYG